MHTAKKEKEEQREKERKTDGVKWPTQEANGNPKGDEKDEKGGGGFVTSMATQCVCHLFGFYVALL